MLLQILHRTPSWVFGVFFLLLALGLWQSRPRRLKRGRLVLLPLMMLALSLYGVLSAFGATPAALACWTLGLGLAISAALHRPATRALHFDPAERSLWIAGSWWPLAGMMALFFTKYAVGVTLARQLPVASTPVFINLISLSYGLFSGAFLAHAMRIWRAAHAPAASSPA